MPAFQVLHRAPAPDWLRRRLYGGDILIVRGAAPAQRLVDYLDRELRHAFAPSDPPQAQFTLPPDAWHARAAELRARYKSDEQARSLMADLLAHFGLDPGRTAADVVNLRCQPHAEHPAPDPRHTLAAHRDTWASNVYQQINWWLPVYPITAGRTIRFFPFYWSQPIANDSADWDLERIRAEIRAARTEGRTAEIRNVPEPTEPLAEAHAVPVVIEPGDVLLFSAAHLHGSVPNASGATRFSVELRSVDIVDVAQGIGAPNIDGAAPHAGWAWFRRLDTGARLAEPAAKA